MLTSQDFKELLSILAKHETRYLIIGGYAVMKYTEPRWTKDLDLFIAIDRAGHWDERIDYDALGRETARVALHP